MRLLYHHRTASKDGQEVHISELIAALRAAGAEVLVVAPSGSDSDGRMGGSRGGLVRLRALVPDFLMPLAARAYEAVFTRRLIRAGRAFGADAVYERHALDNRTGVRAARALGVPLLLEVNAPLAREEAAEGKIADLAGRLGREIETLAAADAVLVVTRVLGEILAGDGVDRARIHVIPNGIALDSFMGPRDPAAKARLGLEGRLVLGFVGFPRPWHGLDRVVRALAGAGAGPLRGAILLIGGEGPALPDLLRLAQDLGVAEQVVVRGVLDRGQVPAFLDAFDVALQPHATAYASPLKLFEYLARGVPVIAPAQANILEVLEHGRSGHLFQPGDDAAFARALTELAADPELRRRIGAGGRQRLLDGGFTWTANAERVLALARQLAEEGRR